MFIIIGLLLLFGAISAIIVTIQPWTVSEHFCVILIFYYMSSVVVVTDMDPHFLLQQIGAAFLLVLLLLILAIGVIHYWASNNFYLTRLQMLFVCFVAFLLAIAAFLVGRFQGSILFSFFESCGQ